jgi:hypothetical protein
MNLPAEVKRYIKLHPATIKGFDQVAGSSPDVLTADLVGATRKVSSRISNTEADWFVRRGANAPWGTIRPHEDFAEADVLQVGGLYDRATELWNHFWHDRPHNVAEAKVSKVLFMMRPYTSHRLHRCCGKYNVLSGMFSLFRSSISLAFPNRGTCRRSNPRAAQLLPLHVTMGTRMIRRHPICSSENRARDTRTDSASSASRSSLAASAHRRRPRAPVDVSLGRELRRRVSEPSVRRGM